jgi:hypothetical protein
LRSPCQQGIGTSHSQTRQRSRPAVPDDASVVENLLKLGGGGAALFVLEPLENPFGPRVLPM